MNCLGELQLSWKEFRDSSVASWELEEGQVAWLSEFAHMCVKAGCFLKLESDRNELQSLTNDVWGLYCEARHEAPAGQVLIRDFGDSHELSPRSGS